MKTWTIALKDTLIRFRDRNAILLMIAAPLLIALVMGAAFGGQNGDTSPIYEIPVVLINADEGDLGQEFLDILTSIKVETTEGVKPLFLATEMTNVEEAKTLIEEGESRGVVYLPPKFSATLRSGVGEDAERGTATVEVFTDPASSVSPGIIRGVVARIASGFSTVLIGNSVAVAQLLNHVTDIPVVFVNEDTGPVSEALNDAFAPGNFDDLFILTTADTLAEAQSQLDAGDVQAIIHITDQFSNAVMTGADSATVAENVEIITAPILAASLVEDVALGVIFGFGSDADPNADPEPSTILTNLENLEDILNEENTSFAETEGPRNRITVGSTNVGTGEEFNLLNYHVLPNSLAPLIVQATLGLGTAVIETAALGFLGLGQQPPFPELGKMLAESQQSLASGKWWVMVFPGAAIIMIVLGFNLLGDGLRDVLDPRLKK